MAQTSFFTSFLRCKCKVDKDNIIWLTETDYNGRSFKYNFTDVMRKLQSEKDIYVKVSYDNNLEHTKKTDF